MTAVYDRWLFSCRTLYVVVSVGHGVRGRANAANNTNAAKADSASPSGSQAHIARRVFAHFSAYSTS